MMPVYRYMESHPMCGDQVPNMQHYHPSFGAIPPHMQVDPSRSGAVYGLWPYGNNFGYSVPCHAFCGHGNFGGYYSPRPPCHHFPPSQYQCYGNPPYHEAVPIQYVPPPHYSMEHPSFGYDKVVSSNNHCCGCPNHTHNQKSDERVKVEELDPDMQKKGGGSLVPFQVKNYPYPIMWIPPDNTKNKEPRKSVESEMASSEKPSQGTVAPESVKPYGQEPRLWNDWFPLDMKSFGPLIQAEDQKGAQNHQNEDKMQQFPFPMFWLPPYNKQDDIAKEDGAQTIASPKPVDEPPSAVKFFPVKLHGSGNGSNKIQVVQDNSRDQISSETEEKRVLNQKGTPVKQMEIHGEKEGVNEKSIPVQKMEAFREKENYEGIDKRGRATSLTNAEGDRISNASGTCAKRQSLSPPKTLKLPPVCLRVDPLPKKKNGSLGSRSHSPPGSKRQPRETSKDTSKAPAQVQDGALSSSKQVEANKKEGKVIEVMERNSIKNKDSETRNGSQTLITFTDPQKEVFRSQKAEEAETHDDKCVNKEDQGATDAGGVTAGKATKSKEVTDANGKRRNLSDEEAALLIQSAYRGFELRTWEPLKKLKQIAQVQEQVVEVKDKIHALESSFDLQNDDRQRLVIGEIIMSLLLKLDAIQGLHPTLRDIRKSLARELVALQEKLDSLIMKKCEETAEPKNSEENLVVSSNIMVNQDAPKMEAGEQPSYFPYQMNALVDSEDEEITNSPILVKEEHRKSQNEVGVVEIDGGAHVAERENKVGSGEFLSGEVVMTENGQGVIVPSAIEQTVLSQSQESDKEAIRGTLPEDMRKSPQNEQPFEVTKLTDMEKSPEVNGIEALLHEITGKVAAISDEEQECGTAMVAVTGSEQMESNASRFATTAAAVDSTTAEKTSEVNLQKEFPLGLIDEEAPEKLENSNIQEKEIPSGGDNKKDTEPSSLNEEVMIPIESEHQCMEVCNEGAFPAESEDSVKAGLEKDDGHEDAMVGVCVQRPQALAVNNDEEQVESNASRFSSTAAAVDSTTAEKTSEVNLQKEFPLGLIDEEAPEKLENLNIQEKEIPSGVDNKEDTEPSSLNEEVMIPIELEHQCMEVRNEGAFPAESEDSVKAGLEEDDSHEDAVVGVCVQQPQALAVNNDEEQVEVLGQEKVLDFSEVQEESNEEKQKDGNFHTEHSCSTELANKMIFSQEKEVQTEKEKESEFQPMTDCGNEDMKLELGVLSDHDKTEDQVDGSEITRTLSVLEPQFSPMGAGHDEEKIGVLPAPSPFIASQLFTDEQGMGMGSDRKLVEENEKLREMMERLIETGKGQLTVITDLTERVKDLEKKLSKKKKVKARRCRTATPPSNARPLVKSPRRAGVSV